MKAQLDRLSVLFFNQSLGLALIRIAAGVIFVSHGWMKFQNLEGTAGFFSMIGLSMFWVYAITFVEIVGGAMLILGILPRVAGVATGIAMLVALSLVGIPKGNYEFEMLLAACSFGIALAGAGRYAVLRLNPEY